jgi:hypothetical protein
MEGLARHSKHAERRPRVATVALIQNYCVKPHDREGLRGHKQPVSMLLLVFLRRRHFQPADVKGVPVLSRFPQLRDENNQRLVHWKVYFCAPSSLLVL